MITKPILVTNNNKLKKVVTVYSNTKSKAESLEVSDIKGKKFLDIDVVEGSIVEANIGEKKDVILTFKDSEGDVLEVKKVSLTEEISEDAVIEEDEVLERLKVQVKTQLDSMDLSRDGSAYHTDMIRKSNMDKQARLYVENRIKQVLLNEGVDDSKIEEYIYKIYSTLYGMGILQELDDDQEVGEILVNATEHPNFKCDVYYIKNGVKHLHDKTFTNLQELKQILHRSIEFSKKELNAVENAVIEATRSNGDRVNVIIPDASTNYVLNIRKFCNFIPNKASMMESGTINEPIDKLLDVLVRGKSNIGVGGEMGTGKTTFINYLLTYTKPIERKVVIASVSETDVDRVLKGHDVVILNVDDDKGFSFDKLIKASLRTTASRVIIPESRGDEFKQVYEANLKTKGNMFTAHALTDESFLDMCTDMYLSSDTGANEKGEYVKDKLSKSIDIVIIMRKVEDKIRIKSISEILLGDDGRYKGMNPLIEWDFDPNNPQDGRYKISSNISDDLKKRLNENGVPMSELEELGGLKC